MYLNINHPNKFYRDEARKTKQLHIAINPNHTEVARLSDIVSSIHNQLREDPSLREYYFNWELELDTFLIIPNLVLLNRELRVESSAEYINNPSVRERASKLKMSFWDSEGTTYCTIPPMKENPNHEWIIRFYSEPFARLVCPDWEGKYTLFNYFNNLFLTLNKGNKSIVLEVMRILTDSVGGLNGSVTYNVYPIFQMLKEVSIYLKMGNKLPKNWSKALRGYSLTLEHNLNFLNSPTVKTLLDDFATYSTLDTMYRKYGLEYLGLMENRQQFIAEEDFKDWYSKKLFTDSRDLILSIYPNKKKTFLGWEIQELTSKRDFDLEGKRQHHCIAGYAPLDGTVTSRYFTFSKIVKYSELKTPKKRGAFYHHQVAHHILFSTGQNVEEPPLLDPVIKEVEKEVRFTTQISCRGTIQQLKGLKNVEPDHYGKVVALEVRAVAEAIAQDILDYEQTNRRQLNDDF